VASELDKIEEELQRYILGNYSATVIDHAQNPRNTGRVYDADGLAVVTGPCGDTMEIWIKVREGIINRATFWTDGCGTTIAAGSMITELAKGKTVSEAFAITQQQVLNALGGLPEESIHCALLAADTLREAIKDYLDNRNEPWKKAYKKS